MLSAFMLSAILAASATVASPVKLQKRDAFSTNDDSDVGTSTVTDLTVDVVTVTDWVSIGPDGNPTPVPAPSSPVTSSFTIPSVNPLPTTLSSNTSTAAVPTLTLPSLHATVLTDAAGSAVSTSYMLTFAAASSSSAVPSVHGVAVSSVPVLATTASAFATDVGPLTVSLVAPTFGAAPAPLSSTTLLPLV